MNTPRPRIAILRHFYFPQCVRVYKEAIALYDNGFDVDVICLRGEGQSARDRVRGVNVYRLGHSHQRGSTARYLLEYALSLLFMTWRLTCLGLRRRYAAVQVNTMPDALVFATWPLRFLRRTRVLLDLHEPAPELYRTRAGADVSSFLLKSLVTLERWAIRYADHAITVNDTIRRRFIERGANPAKLEVVRNVPAEDFRAPAAVTPDAGFCLITHGTLQPRYGHDVVIRAVARLRGRIPGLRLRILGFGETVPQLHALATSLGCSDMVSFDPRVPFDEVPAHLLKARVGLVPLAPGPFSELCQPNKLFEYAALRIPIIAARFPAIAETMDEGCVAFFTPGDDADLAARILELYSDPDRCARLAEQAYGRFEAVQWARTKNDYIGIMNRMIGTRGPRGGGP